MTWQEVYMLPLTINEYAPFMVHSANNHHALDFLFDYNEFWGKSVIDVINQKYTMHFTRKFTYDGHGTIFYGSEECLLIRGWGYLTGVGGLNLSSEEACKIQDEFGNFIVAQLNQS